MPIHMPSLNRRQFLITAGAALGAAVVSPVGLLGDDVEGDLVYHGHIHDRSLAEHQGIHIINTPATSYVGNPDVSTTGWTTARLTATGVTLVTHTTDIEHPWNQQSKTIEWRG